MCYYKIGHYYTKLERPDNPIQAYEKDFLGFRPLRWREALCGGAPPDHTQNEEMSYDVIENKG
jgi:hypothetical protein